jgi:hypothetical protein
VNPLYDLDELARWWPTLVGRAIDPEYTLVRGGNRAESGRPDHVDAHHEGLARALQARARLALLRATADGAVHAAVLEFAYVRLGPAFRTPSAEDIDRQTRALDDWHRITGGWYRWFWSRGKREPMRDSIDPGELLSRARRAPGVDREVLLVAGRRLLRQASAAYQHAAAEIKGHF